MFGKEPAYAVNGRALLKLALLTASNTDLLSQKMVCSLVLEARPQRVAAAVCLMQFPAGVLWAVAPALWYRYEEQFTCF